jgi:uncharacterized protein (TIGR02996 family)
VDAVNDDETFLATVLGAPGDTLTPLVYADWLEERGDPRGEYLRLLVGLDDPTDPDCSTAPRQRLRELRERIAPEWADRVDRTRILFDGLYQADKEGGSWDYLRFFADGTVDSANSTGTPKQVWRWFDQEHRVTVGHSHGVYTIRADQISFFVAGSSGRIEFTGTVGPCTLALKFPRHRIGSRATRLYRFVALGPKGAR